MAALAKGCRDLIYRIVFNDLADALGTATRECRQLGSIALFFWRIIQAIPSCLKRFHLIVEQMMLLGVTSIPIVLLTSVFVRCSSAWQVQYLFADAVPLTYLGAAVGKAVFTELG